MATENESLRQLVATIHIDMSQLKRSVEDVKEKVDKIQLQMAEQRGEQTASKKLREKLEDLPAQHDELQKEVENIKKHQKDEDKEEKAEKKSGKNSAIVHIVESENGRKVIFWALGAFLIGVLAMSGSLATQDVQGLVRLWVGGGVPVQVPVPVQIPIQPKNGNFVPAPVPTEPGMSEMN